MKNEKECYQCKKPSMHNCNICKKPICSEHQFLIRKRLVCEKCFYIERKKGLFKQIGLLGILISAAIFTLIVIF